jgi:hypothetical protein
VSSFQKRQLFRAGNFLTNIPMDVPQVSLIESTDESSKESPIQGSAMQESSD